HVGWTVLERDDVRVLDLQLRGVLDRDHTLVGRDEPRDDVERGRLAGTGASGDQDVHAAEHGRRKELGHRRAEAAFVLEVFDAEDRVLELADRQRGAVDGGRPDDGVDAAAVREARVDHRVESVDVAPGRGDHAPDRLEELVLVLEADVGLGQHAAPLDEYLVGAVDHDLAHRPVVEQAVERSVADRRAQDDVGKRRLLLRVEDDAVFQQEPVEMGAHSAREGERVAGGEAYVANQRKAVAEAEDGLFRRARIAWVGLEARVVDRAEDYIFDVARRYESRTIRVRVGVDGKAIGRDRARVGFAVLKAAVETVDDDLDTRQA